MVKKILLIFPKHLWYWSAPPAGIGYIASSLEAIGYKVKLVDCQVTPDYKKKIISSLADYPAVGISVNAGNVSSALDIARVIRQHSPKTKIIMGGPHATAVYDILIPEYADIVVRGEGEDTVTELFQTDDLTKVKGIAYWDSSLKLNPPRPYIEDLDRLRFPAWHLYDLKRYRLGNTHSPLAIIITSRGCPYDCIYCVKFIHGYNVRFRSVDNVLSEIDSLANKSGVREIHFVDDNFTLYPQRVEEICNSIIMRKYNSVLFSVLASSNFGSPDMLKLMKQANFYSIGFAVESGSQEVLSRVGRKIDFDKLKTTIRMANKVGLTVNINFMLGLPFDTIKTMQETMDLAKELTQNLSVAESCFAIAIPFPGTKFYEMVKGDGRFLCDLNVTSIAYNGKPVYETDNLKADDVERMFRRIYREFYFKPGQILKKAIAVVKFRSIKSILDFVKQSFKLIAGTLQKTRVS